MMLILESGVWGSATHPTTSSALGIPQARTVPEHCNEVFAVFFIWKIQIKCMFEHPYIPSVF